MSFCRASTSTLRAISHTAPPCRSFSTSSSASLEPKYFNPWHHKSHLKPPPTLPNPLPRLYPQKIVLSDGSTFTSYSTAPTPAIVRLTRDVTNNPLWAPGTEKGGLGDDEDGRVGKFRKRFSGMDLAYDASGAQGGEGEGEARVAAEGSESEVVDAKDGVVRDGDGTVVDDLSWMSEGAREEKAPPPKVKKSAPTKGGGKKK